MVEEVTGSGQSCFKVRQNGCKRPGEKLTCGEAGHVEGSRENGSPQSWALDFLAEKQLA